MWGKQSKKHYRQGGRTRRRGSATVEMAIVAPLLLGMVGGVIEYGYLFMAQSVLTNAAREAARMATLPGASDSDIQTRFTEAIQPLGLEAGSYELTIQHATAISDVETVSAQIPWSAVSLTGGLPVRILSVFSPGDGGSSPRSAMFATCSMRKE